MSGLISSDQVPIEVALVVVSLAAAVVDFWIGARLARRPVSASSRLASYQFSLWWIGIGSSAAVNALLIGLALANALPFALAIAIYLTSLLVDCVFLGALVGALTYVYTGAYHLVELGAFYFAFYVALHYWSLSQAPQGVALSAGVPALAFGAPPNGVLTAAVTIGLIVPGIVASIFYLTLLRESRDRSIRYRIALVGASVLLWFSLEIAIPSSTADWLLVRSALTVVPGVLSLIALIPPAWVRRRLGVAAPGGPEEYYRRQRAPP